MLHYHPLVIYRFQVIKQADVVLAMFLHGDRFTPEEKRADVEYYDPITTGDSTLSAVVQSIMAAEVGYHEPAMDYFRQALHVDLGDLHRNTVDGIHLASAAGIWSVLTFGFGGMRDHAGRLTFDPRLPAEWTSLEFAVTWRGSRMRVTLNQSTLELRVESGSEPVEVVVRGAAYVVGEESVRIEVHGQGPRIDGLLGDKPHTGGIRADGTRITAGVPDPVTLAERRDPPAEAMPATDPDAVRS
jgi:alpha,alpha-trehalose phosphorylase